MINEGIQTFASGQKACKILLALLYSRSSGVEIGALSSSFFSGMPTGPGQDAGGWKGLPRSCLVGVGGGAGPRAGCRCAGAMAKVGALMSVSAPVPKHPLHTRTRETEICTHCVCLHPKQRGRPT